MVDKYNGYVVSSNVTSGRTPGPTPVPENGQWARSGGAGRGGGSGSRRSTSQNLRFGRVSKLARVTSRTEGVKDITKRFDDAKAASTT